MSTFSPWKTTLCLKFHIPSTTKVIVEETHQLSTSEVVVEGGGARMSLIMSPLLIVLTLLLA